MAALSKVEAVAETGAAAKKAEDPELLKHFKDKGAGWIFTNNHPAAMLFLGEGIGEASPAHLRLGKATLLEIVAFHHALNVPFPRAQNWIAYSKHAIVNLLATQLKVDIYAFLTLIRLSSDAALQQLEAVVRAAMEESQSEVIEAAAWPVRGSTEEAEIRKTGNMLQQALNDEAIAKAASGYESNEIEEIEDEANTSSEAAPHLVQATGNWRQKKTLLKLSQSQALLSATILGMAIPSAATLAELRAYIVKKREEASSNRGTPAPAGVKKRNLSAMVSEEHSASQTSAQSLAEVKDSAAAQLAKVCFASVLLVFARIIKCDLLS